MKLYKTNEIKNITITGNSGSGKTTLTESLVFHSGITKRRGTIADKNTLSDNRQIEHEYGCSIYSSVLHTFKNDKKINIIDTPRASSFSGALVSSLYVSEAALMVLNTQNGVEVETQITWKKTEKLNKPVIFVANHLDHDQTNFANTIEQLNELCGKGVVIVQYPVNPGPEFNSIIDLIKMKMYTWKANSEEPEVADIPADEADRAEELRSTLVETAAENDEKLMEIFFEKDGLTEDQIREGVIKGFGNRGLFPVFCVQAKRGYGIGRLLEFVSNVVPSPEEAVSIKTTSDDIIKCDASAQKSVFIFKTTVEPHLGEVSYFKVMSGSIKEGEDLINTSKDSKERISQIYVSNGKERTKVDELVAGDIGTTIKLKASKTGHTLCEKNMAVTYKGIPFPNAKYRTAIKAKNESDDEKLGEVLHRLHDEDPTWILEYSKELKQLIIHGQGEYHLNTLKWHLDHEYKIETEFIAPKIPYRETITKPAQADFRHKKQSGGAGQFGEVHLIVAPYNEGKKTENIFKINGKEFVLSLRDTKEFDLSWGGKLLFFNCIVGGVIDANYMPAIVKGLMEKIENGPLTGSYARDICVYVYDGKMHPVDSNEISFKLAGAKAFSAAFKLAGPKLMEPIYEVTVTLPGERMGDVMSDLQGRRAMILGMESEKGMEKIKARVPLAELNRYATSLSSITQGRATYEMEFLEYAQVPGELQDQLIKKHSEENQEE